MSAHDSDISQADANSLCHAASCVFFALLGREAAELKTRIILPHLLCPAKRLPPPCTLDPDLVREATAMLLRMGVVELDDDGQVHLVLVRHG